MDKSEVNTRLRLPSELHHKLNILANADKRSLHSFMLYVLEKHVVEFEQQILDTYGYDGFDEAYESIFGNDSKSHLFINEADFEMKAKLDRLRRAREIFSEPSND